MTGNKIRFFFLKLLFKKENGGKGAYLPNSRKQEMQISIQELLKERIEASKNNNLEAQFDLERREHQKKWAAAVQFFQNRINKDRLKDKMRPLPFIAIRSKLEHVHQIDDLRWFYTQCLKYSRNKGNTFSKCFFGALK